MCGANHALALSKLGILYTWGDNKFGALGNGNILSLQEHPKKIRWNYGRYHNYNCADVYLCAVSLNIFIGFILFIIELSM